jgi:hypothetical protein
VSEFVFDITTHTYTVDGKVLPSVTQVIQAAGLIDFSMIPPDRLKAAADLGTAVHLATEYDDQGRLDPASIDPVVAPYLAQWRRFKDDFNYEMISSEKRMYSQKYGYAGTIDRGAVIRLARTPRRCVIDIKTGFSNQIAGVQLAAYLELLMEKEKWTGKDICVMVHLTPDKYEVKEFSSTRYFPIFLSALNLYKFKQGGMK